MDCHQGCHHNADNHFHGDNNFHGDHHSHGCAPCHGGQCHPHAVNHTHHTCHHGYGQPHCCTTAVNAGFVAHARDCEIATLVIGVLFLTASVILLTCGIIFVGGSASLGIPLLSSGGVSFLFGLSVTIASSLTLKHLNRYSEQMANGVPSAPTEQPAINPQFQTSLPASLPPSAPPPYSLESVQFEEAPNYSAPGSGFASIPETRYTSSTFLTLQPTQMSSEL